MKTIRDEDINSWVGLMVNKAFRNAEKTGINVLKDIKFSVMTNTAFIKIEFSHCNGETPYIDSGYEGGEFESTVDEIKSAIAGFTAELNVVDSYIKNYGYIILSISDNIQVV